MTGSRNSRWRSSKPEVPIFQLVKELATRFQIIIYTLITIKVSKMTKVTSQALYKKNIEIKEKKKKINESSDDF